MTGSYPKRFYTACVLAILVASLGIAITIPLVAQDAEFRGYIAYVGTYGENEDIYLTDAQGSFTYNVTNSTARDIHPDWSPNGQQLSFVSNRDGNDEIYVIAASGGEAKNLTNNLASDVAGDWSPIDDRIVFVSDRDGGYDLYTISASNGEVTRLTTDGVTKSAPTWSPDGSQVAYWQKIGEENHILVLNLATNTIQTLVGSGNNNWPAWSPDGTTLAYFATTDTAQIFTVLATGGTPLQITSGNGSNARPAWSFDGTQITFTSDRNGNFDVFVMDADGSNQRQITTNTENDHSPAWQPIPSVITVGDKALGQSYNQVVSGTTESQQIGEGELRVFAPQQVGIRDRIRIRLEVEASTLIEDIAANLPTSTPVLDLGPTPTSLPLVGRQFAQLYDIMGAELVGLDLDRFDIVPAPTNFVIQLEPGAVNFWEWNLRAKGSEAVGVNFLQVQLYLPEQQSDGVVIKRVLNTVDVTIEVVGETPPVDQQYVVSDAPTRGVSLQYSEKNALFIIFAQDVVLDSAQISSVGGAYLLKDDFPVLQNSDTVLAGTCLVYVLENQSPTIPRACQNEKRFQIELTEPDIFWFDKTLDDLADVMLQLNGESLNCPSQEQRCDF